MRKLTDLLEETRGAIRGTGRHISTASWIGSKDGTFGMSWWQFENIANVEYHKGYGGQEVAKDLVVVFTDGRGWLERVEYDGSERWEYKECPTIQTPHRIPQQVVDRESYGCSVARMHGIRGADDWDDDD